MPENMLAHSDLAGFLTTLSKRMKNDVVSLSREDLERYWDFESDPAASKAWNVYQFHRALSTYGSVCRQWEEAHNGYACVVERVRDRYLLPKIRAFVKTF